MNQNKGVANNDVITTAFYRNIMEQARDIILVLLPDGTILDANQAALDAYGYSSDELRARTIYELRATETREEIDAQLRKAKTAGILFRTFHLRRDGAPFPVEVSSRRVDLGGGEVLVSIIRDITETVAIEIALSEGEEKFRLLVENLRTGVFMVQKDQFVYVNPSTQRITGFDEAELLKMNFWEIVHPDQREEVRQRGIRRQQGFSEPTSYIMHIQRKNGDDKWCEVVVARPIWAGIVTLIGLLHDVTDRLRAEERLAISEKKYRLLAENVGDVIWTIDLKGNFTYISPSIQRTYGFAPEELLNRKMLDLVADEFRPVVEEHFRELLAGEQQESHSRMPEFQMLHRNGSRLWVEVRINQLKDDDAQVSGLLGIARDITDRKRLQEDLVRLATIDDLTGSVNRSRFMELGNQEIERANRYNRPFSLMFVDLDYFKQINDTFGHKAGDLTLIWFADLVRKEIRNTDILGRLGGDEFAVLLPETELDQASLVAERIRATLESQKLPVGETDQVSLTVSIGVASREKTSLTLEDLLKKADAALYHAKRLGRNRVQIDR